MICQPGLRCGFPPKPRYAVKLIVFCLLTQAQVALAIFSDFVVITPQNETEHPFEIQVHAIVNRPGHLRIRVIGPVDGDQVAWLVLCQRSLPPEKQKFRQAIWQGTTGHKDIVQITRLTPQPVPGKAGADNRPFVETVLTDDEMKRSYLYVDYPDSVDDGGYFYSIDLAYYLPGPAGKKSMIRWEHNP